MFRLINLKVLYFIFYYLQHECYEANNPSHTKISIAKIMFVKKIGKL